ncbi:glycyl-radical enzyme activating protein [Thiohalocapsa sp.]|uniref:glycyl-radical enzyme activating protein n=1 Tax=Thiohalocapsa sp. TaxID=2497641 RepID=UPI0025F1C99B|nr:glycyl-radical enzyme activating protein [Thiohalocapsa sp.]
MTKGIIFDIKQFSIHDGPGIRTTVFLKGCPLSCWWCHNPEGQAMKPELILRPERCIGCGACLEVCEQGAILWRSGQDGERIVTDRERCTACGDCVQVCYAEARELVGREVTVAEVMDAIERDTAFYDQSGGGVTVSGGEPLAQPDFLRELLRACQYRGLHTALDTCGFAPWEALDSVRQYVDLFLYDLKLMDDARHRAFTGVSNERILENLQRLSREGHRLILRVPIIPGINDDEENLQAIGAFAADLPHLKRVDLLPYHRIGRDKYRRLGKPCPMPETEPPSEARMDEIAQVLRKFDLPVSLNH